MFVSKTLEKIMELENRIIAMRSLIREAEYYQNFEEAAEYICDLKKMEAELKLAKIAHANSCNSEEELVYSI